MGTALGTKVPSDGGPPTLNPVLAGFSSEERLSSGRSWRSGVPSQVGRRFGPTSYLEFCEDARHIVLHRLFGKVKFVADLLIGLAVSDEPEDSLLLA